MQSWLTYSGAIGTVAMFLPFTYDVAPIQAVAIKEVWPLALPFLLAPLIFVASWYFLRKGAFSPFWKVAGYSLGGATALLMCSFWLRANSMPGELTEWLGLLLAVGILLLGGGVVVNRLRRKEPADYAPLLVLQLVYLANCVMCLLLLWPQPMGFLSHQWQAGAGCSIVTALIYLLQMGSWLFPEAFPKSVQQE